MEDIVMPNDPVMLLSYINTRLRDEFDSMEELCLALDVKKSDIDESLLRIGCRYDSTQNRYR